MSTSSFSRHGAVDLSQLAQKAKQPPPSAGIPTGAGGRTAGGGSYVVELTEQTFESVAIRASMQYPVIVEFYSSSRATAGSQELSTALADLASSSDGKFLLGRLDIDTAQQIAGATLAAHITPPLPRGPVGAVPSVVPWRNARLWLDATG